MNNVHTSLHNENQSVPSVLRFFCCVDNRLRAHLGLVGSVTTVFFFFSYNSSISVAATVICSSLSKTLIQTSSEWNKKKKCKRLQSDAGTENKFLR